MNTLKNSATLAFPVATLSLSNLVVGSIAGPFASGAARKHGHPRVCRCQRGRDSARGPGSAVATATKSSLLQRTGVTGKVASGACASAAARQSAQSPTRLSQQFMTWLSTKHSAGVVEGAAAH